MHALVCPFLFANDKIGPLRRFLYKTFQNARNRAFAYVYFTVDVFCFHVLFYGLKVLIINAFKLWNIVSRCFIFSFNVSFQKHWGRKTKTLRERFQNTVGAISKHNGSDHSLPLCFLHETLKLKVKHWSSMFHVSRWLIFN